jgi:hypothetical protein
MEAEPECVRRSFKKKMFTNKSNVSVASMNSCFELRNCVTNEDNVLIHIVGDVMYVNIVSTVGNENGLLFSHCNTLFCCDVCTH